MAGFVDGGKVSVKNIDRPIGVWRWQAGTTGGEPVAGVVPPAAKARASSCRSTTCPAIQSRRFLRRHQRGHHHRSLKIGGLVVIARNSSFVYKGRSVDIREVAKDLGVGTVLEGSIRRPATVRSTRS
ncbi:MAG: hypothetical protein R3D25_14130 [Geminicoccaceae bacterium]